VNYDEALAWLYGTQLHGVKLGLENIRRLVGELGVQLESGRGGAPKFLHVAGTNGKGSTCAMLDAICRAAGLRCGLFTSPHLVTFRERIRLDGEMISEGEVALGLTRIRALTAQWDHSATFFEIVTALALAYFETHGAEIVILETGMGGRLDATNVVTPAVSVITPISLDHQQWLGSSIPEIAAEKAGIIKPGVPVISARQTDEAWCVLAHLAVEREAAFHQVATPLRLPVALPGRHQQWNAALAVHALDLAGITVPGAAVAEGLRTVQWPGRFQRIGERIILDGAHNPAAAAVLAETWRDVFGGRKATLILGVLRDKDAGAIWPKLRHLAARVITVTLTNERTLSAAELAQVVSEDPQHPDVSSADTPAKALAAAEAYDEAILVTGSLFLVGEALAHLEARPEQHEPSAQ
jgi:dihydrofolate synthase/folylpolyglutamate synthase